MWTDAETLVLTPTEFERRALAPLLPGRGALALTGFGPVAAAASTARLLAERRPRRAVLIGLAGTFDPSRDPIGSAATFWACGLDGVGAGSQTARTLGFPQALTDPPVFDTVPPNETAATIELLTVCRASDSLEEAAARSARFPNARLEEMEGFGFALAAWSAAVPYAIVRGVANLAGDRDPGRWRVSDALTAASAVLRDHLRGEST